MGSPTQGQFSAWHYLTDIEEAWHHHAGDDVLIYWIDKNAQLQSKLLGTSEHAEPQVHIPANSWFAAVVNNNDQKAYTLVSCTCFPGFDFANFQLADRRMLIDLYPQHQKIIEQLTRI